MHISSGKNWFCTAAENRFGSLEVALLWKQWFRKHTCNKSENKTCSVALEKKKKEAVFGSVCVPTVRDEFFFKLNDFHNATSWIRIFGSFSLYSASILQYLNVVNILNI